MADASVLTVYRTKASQKDRTDRGTGTTRCLWDLYLYERDKLPSSGPMLVAGWISWSDVSDRMALLVQCQ